MSYYRRQKKGHGCVGAFVAFIIVLILICVLLMFFTDTLDGVKYRFVKLVYPTKYSEQVEKYSKENNLDEALVYGLIKKESNFDKDATSSVGARGLTQIMPETFEWLQISKDGAITHSKDDLYDPDISIEYGTYLLSYLMKVYNYNEKNAVAAYNAGETAVNEWLSNKEYSSDGTTLTKIPYEETEKYVEGVLEAKEVYTKILESENKTNGKQ